MNEEDMYWKCFDTVFTDDKYYYAIERLFFEFPVPPEKVAEMLKEAFSENIDNMFQFGILPQVQKTPEKFAYYLDKSKNP